MSPRDPATRPSAPTYPFAMSIANLSLRENWVGLESNPEVLTEYAHKMGVSKYAATAFFYFADSSPLFCHCSQELGL